MLFHEETLKCVTSHAPNLIEKIYIKLPVSFSLRSFNYHELMCKDVRNLEIHIFKTLFPSCCSHTYCLLFSTP